MTWLPHGAINTPEDDMSFHHKENILQYFGTILQAFGVFTYQSKVWQVHFNTMMQMSFIYANDFFFYWYLLW